MNWPRVSIGLPVYNGEKYLREAIDCILRQTYRDFVLIISDNASTDQTPEICVHYAAKDSRVHYHRNEENIGGFLNANLVFGLSKGEYFLWAAHDDVSAPEYVERCLEILDKHPNVVISYSKTRYIDEHGQIIPKEDLGPRANAEKAHERFKELIQMQHPVEPILGLIRSSVLRRTALFGQFAGSDRTLMAELGLHGPFCQIPEYLFFKREHPLQSTALYPSRHQRTAWFAPKSGGKLVFPHFRLFREHLVVVKRVGPSFYDRVWCYIHMLSWLKAQWHQLTCDLEMPAIYILRPLVHAYRRKGRATAKTNG